MVCFVLTSLTRDRYIYFDDYRRISVTKDINQAKVFSDITKARNFLDNQVPKKKRDEWMVLTTEASQPKKSTPERFRANQDYSKSEAELRLEDYIDSTTGSYQSLRDYREYLHKELAKAEAELCDIEHAIEFFNYSASDGYKMCKMLHDCRVRRRGIKNDLHKVNVVLNTSYKQKLAGEVDEAFEEVDTQTYEPRALPELFERKKP